MASTYSPALRLELMATGDQSGTWGDTTNTNLGTLLEQAITGYLSVAQGDVANLTLTTTDGASDQARNAVVEITGALTATRNVVVQTAEKLYTIKNSTTGGFSIVAKTTAGTGISIPPGASVNVYSDGTNVVMGQNYWNGQIGGAVYLDAGATVGPAMDLFRDSTSPAASDVMGQVVFNGRDSAANKQEYASIEAVIVDPTSTSEDGQLDLYATVAGTRTKLASVFGTGVGIADGTVSLPGLSFISDPDSGLYRIGANNIGAAVNGAKVLDVATTGLAVTGTLSSTGVLTASSTIELGHASDTTLSRAAAGVAAIEGRPIVTVVREQVFTGSGTYTPHANMVYCIIQVVGSGGGAGGCTGAANQGYGGGGGGGGGCARKIASAATIGASQTVTIGAVGTGGTASANGTAGSDCSVGALAVGKGGAGGLYGAAAQRGLGGAGGVAGTGDVNIPGQSGGDGDYINSVTVTNFNVFSGYGGSSLFGYGAKGVTLNTAGALGGTAGQNYGTGGSGATSVNTTSTANGGNGSTGIVVITEFCSA